MTTPVPGFMAQLFAFGTITMAIILAFTDWLMFVQPVKCMIYHYMSM